MGHAAEVFAGAVAGKALYIYGAQPIAYGVSLALRQMGIAFRCYVVTSRTGNPEAIAGVPVRELVEVDADNEAVFLLAVPEYLQPEIRVGLAEHGFCNVIGMGPELEFELMRDYYREQGLGFADNSQEAESGWPPDTEIYVARSAADKPLAHDFPLLPPFCDVQAGAALDKVSPGTAFRDDEGENISYLNRDYAELTVTYWAWKNRHPRFKGLVHYRRYLALSGRERSLLASGAVDAVLPTPYTGWPDASAQYGRYNHPLALRAMLEALDNFDAAEAAAARHILSGPWVYNYNMLVARAEVFDTYAAWLFPRLEMAGEIFRSGEGKKLELDRPVGHIGELLSSLYFMLHYHDLKLIHARKVWLT